MKLLLKTSNHLVSVVTLIFCLNTFFILEVSSAEKPIEKGPIASTENDRIDLNFPSATLDQIIEIYAGLTGRTAIRNSGLQGRITIKSNGSLTKEDAIIAIENVLAANNFSIVLQGDKFFKVVPSPTVKTEGVKVDIGDKKLIPADQTVSRVFQLKFVDVKEAEQAVRVLMHPAGMVTSLPRANALLVTDRSANVLEMAKIITLLDHPLEGKVKAKFYQLKNAEAKDVVTRIKELLEQSPGVQGQKQTGPFVPVPSATAAPNAPVTPPPTVTGTELTFSEEAIVAGKVTIAADERTNQMIVLTRAVNFPFFDQVVEKLDSDTAAPIILKTIPLKYANAEPLSELLNQILGQSGAAPSPKQQRLGDQKNSSASSPAKGRNPLTQNQAGQAAAGTPGAKKEDLSIYVDTRTNSLIALGIKEKIDWIQGFIKDVDVPLPQVLLEGVIVEVTLNGTDNLGIEVLARASTQNASHAILTKTLSLNPIDAAGIIAGTVAAPAAGIPAGITQGLNYFATLKNLNLDILIQALSQRSNVKILSQPLIQTSHNEEARILVGESRPIVTSTETVPGGTTTGGTTGTSSTLRSQYQLQDIALELTIKPLINPGGLVVFDILQKVNSVAGFQTIDNNQVPIISRREANSVVSVQDGEMIILGGLISNTENVTKTGIPFLSEIPILGYLFGSTSKQNIRTELMVLLKPTVLNTPEIASEEALRRRKQLELFNKKSLIQKDNLNEQLDKISKPSSVPAEPADIPEAPVSNFKY